MLKYSLNRERLLEISPHILSLFVGIEAVTGEPSWRSVAAVLISSLPALVLKSQPSSLLDAYAPRSQPESLRLKSNFIYTIITLLPLPVYKLMGAVGTYPV